MTRPVPYFLFLILFLNEANLHPTWSNVRANFIGANVNSSRCLSRRQLKTISARCYSSGNWPLEPVFRQKGTGDKDAFSPDLLARFCRKKERKEKKRFGQKRDRSYFWDSIVRRGNNDDKLTNNRRPLA